jgi:hypothetical protein
VTRGDIGIAGVAMAMTLAAVLRVETLWRGDYVPESEPLAPARPLASMPVAPGPSKPWARPLFSRSNAAGEGLPSGSVSTPGAAPGSQLPRLIGIIINQNDRVAILGYAGKVQRLQESGQIGSWTLSRIERRSALLQNATESHLLKLDPGTK